MKSIYEASVAYSREHQGTVNIEDFEAGANYVLEKVKMLLNSQRFVDDPSQELYELIEQLKK